MCQGPALTHSLDHERSFPNVGIGSVLVVRGFNDLWAAGAAAIIGEQVPIPFYASLYASLTRIALVLCNWKEIVVFVLFVVTSVKE